MHYTTKTIGEYLNKIKRGGNQNEVYNITERIQIFFRHNKITEEKLQIFEKAFNRSFENFRNYKNTSIKANITIKLLLINLLFLFC